MELLISFSIRSTYIHCTNNTKYFIGWCCMLLEKLLFELTNSKWSMFFIHFVLCLRLVVYLYCVWSSGLTEISVFDPIFGTPFYSFIHSHTQTRTQFISFWTLFEAITIEYQSTVHRTDIEFRLLWNVNACDRMLNERCVCVCVIE